MLSENRQSYMKYTQIMKYIFAVFVVAVYRCGIHFHNAMPWTVFPRVWTFVRGVHQLQVKSLHNGPVLRGFGILSVVSLNKLLKNDRGIVD